MHFLTFKTTSEKLILLAGVQSVAIRPEETFDVQLHSALGLSCLDVVGKESYLISDLPDIDPAYDVTNAVGYYGATAAYTVKPKHEPIRGFVAVYPDDLKTVADRYSLGHQVMTDKGVDLEPYIWGNYESEQGPVTMCAKNARVIMGLMSGKTVLVGQNLRIKAGESIVHFVGTSKRPDGRPFGILIDGDGFRDWQGNEDCVEFLNMQNLLDNVREYEKLKSEGAL